MNDRTTKTVIKENEATIIKVGELFHEKLNNLKIDKVWFDNDNIYILTIDGIQKRQP